MNAHQTRCYHLVKWACRVAPAISLYFSFATLTWGQPIQDRIFTLRSNAHYSQLVEIDPISGNAISNSPFMRAFMTIAYEPASGILYGVGTEFGLAGYSTYLYTINIDTGAAFRVGAATSGFPRTALAANPLDHQLYAQDDDGRLYHIAKIAGHSTFLGQIPEHPTKGLAFTPDGKLFRAVNSCQPNPPSNSCNDWMENLVYELSLDQLQAHLIGETTHGMIFGLGVDSNGYLFGISNGTTGQGVVQIDPATAQSTMVLPLTLGRLASLAFVPQGIRTGLTQIDVHPHMQTVAGPTSQLFDRWTIEISGTESEIGSINVRFRAETLNNEGPTGYTIFSDFNEYFTQNAFDTQFALTRYTGGLYVNDAQTFELNDPTGDDVLSGSFDLPSGVSQLRLAQIVVPHGVRVFYDGWIGGATAGVVPFAGTLMEVPEPRSLVVFVYVLLTTRAHRRKRLE